LFAGNRKTQGILLMSIPASILNEVKIIVTHDACPDGLAAAMIAQYSLNTQPMDVRFVQYGTAAHKNLQAEKGMLFTDFSPPPERVQEFVDVGAIVLDHHKTARKVVEAFGDRGVFGDEDAEPGISGATLAFRELLIPLREHSVGRQDKQGMEDFAILAGIRDTWQRTHNRWEESCIQAYALRVLPKEAFIGQPLSWFLSSENWARCVWAGELNFAKHKKTVERACKDAFRFTTSAGTRVVVFQGSKLSSDAGEYLHDSVDLVCGFDAIFEDGHTKYIYSTRSHTDFDCAKFAKSFGGGGHTRAAGFNIVEPAMNPYQLFQLLVQEFVEQNLT
jgi:oligoribonuclease NrnB/cAMP/cGMP phosphodiesterase (DHH superfamily)